MTSNIQLQKNLIKVSKWMIYMVLTISSCVLLGHTLIPSLLNIVCWDKTQMIFTAALGYAFTCIAYLLSTSKKQSKVRSLIIYFISFSLIALGATVLTIQLSGHTVFFLRQIVHKNNELTKTIKIPPIASCFIIYGIAILMINFQTLKKRVPSQYLAIPPLILGGYLFLVFLYNSSVIVNGATDAPLSIYSSIFNLFISFAIFFAHPDRGLALEITKTKTGSNTLLNLLPVVIIIPILIGLMHLIIFPTTLGLALIILLFIILCVVIIFINLKIINRDLEERLIVQSALKESVRNVSHLSDLLERSTDAIMVIDENYIIKKWNKGAEYIYGYSAEEVIGKNKYELLDSAFMTMDQFLDGVNLLSIQGGERTSTRLQLSKSGTILTILQSAIALKDDRGNLTGYIGIGKDITELVEKEKELARLNEVLDKHLNIKTIELNSVYERISDAVIVLDNNWCYTYHNKMAYNLTKETAQLDNSLIGKNIWDTFPFIVNTALSDAYYKAMNNRESNRIEYYYTEFDMWTEQTIYPNPEGISVFLRDITEQKLAEIKQKDAEEKYRTIVETSQEGILIRDTNGIITYVNDYLVKMLKESREYLIGLPLLNLFSDENLKIMQLNMERRNKGITDTYDLTLPLRDGSFITVYIKSTPYHEKGVFAGSLSTITDITDIKNKELELERLSADLRSLYTHLQNIREEERKIMAKEIHDELGQNLTILKLDAAWIGAHVDTDNIKLKERIKQFEAITAETVQTSRRLYNQLYPQMLDDIGLIDTIKWHANSYIKPSNIKFQINTNLSDNLNTHFHNIWLILYRIYQECMTNILKHAEATSIILDFYLKDNTITMVISDDGVGFEIDKINTQLHHGLLGMRERIFSVNGTINIDSSLNNGTTVSISIPINNQNNQISIDLN